MKAEDLKIWLKNTEQEKKAEVDSNEMLAWMRDTWQVLVKLIQHIWDTDNISQQTLATIVVLIPKGIWDISRALDCSR